MDTEAIATLAVAGIGLLATLIARWNETNPALPWYVRLARVADMTQVIDSTRKLGDGDGPQ